MQDARESEIFQRKLVGAEWFPVHTCKPRISSLVEKLASSVLLPVGLTVQVLYRRCAVQTISHKKS
jgi:hypothetical protein